MTRVRMRTSRRAGLLPGRPALAHLPLDEQGQVVPLAERPPPGQPVCSECFGPRSRYADGWFCTPCEMWLFMLAKRADLRLQAPPRPRWTGAGGSCRSFLRGEGMRQARFRNARARAAGGAV